MENNEKKKEVKQTTHKPDHTKKTLEELNKKEELPQMPDADEDNVKPTEGGKSPRKRTSTSSSTGMVNQRMYSGMPDHQNKK